MALASIAFLTVRSPLAGPLARDYAESDVCPGREMQFRALHAARQATADNREVAVAPILT